MSFTREEYVATYRTVFDYGRGVHEHIDNPNVAEIWVGLTVAEREDLACLFALAEALRRLQEDQQRQRDREDAQRERDRLAKRRAAYAARKMMKESAK